MRFTALLFALMLTATPSVSRAATDPCEELAALRASPPAWTATNGASRVILIAVIHALPAQTVWHTKTLEQSIKSADELIVDTDVTSKAVVAAFGKHAFANGLPPIESRVPAELQQALLQASQRTGMSLAVMNRMKTWAVSFLVNGKKAGACRPGPTYQLQKEFESDKREVSALQTADSSLADFDALPESAQRDLLVYALKPNEDDVLRSMLIAWAFGDIDKTAAAAEADLGRSPALRSVLAKQKVRLGERAHSENQRAR